MIAPVAAQSGPDFGGWFDGVDNYSGVVDRTGRAEVAVAVGGGDDGGTYVFTPAAVRVDPGTTVVWKWTDSGLARNVVAADGSFDSGEPVADASHSFSHTFESAGIYRYYCEPYKALGMKGAVVVGDDYPTVGRTTAGADDGRTESGTAGGGDRSGTTDAVSGSGARSSPGSAGEAADGTGLSSLPLSVVGLAGAGVAAAGGGILWLRNGGDSESDPETVANPGGDDTRPPTGGGSPSADAGIPGSGPVGEQGETDGESPPEGPGETGPDDRGPNQFGPGSGGRPAADPSGVSGVPEPIPSAPDLDLERTDLADREPIGGGGNADVYRVSVEHDGVPVDLAVKEPRLQGTLHADQVERMLAEAETWAKLDDHDHVVDVVDYGSDPVPWIAMEYMDAGHLGERAGALSTDRALWTALAVTEAVYHAHRHGVAHLDLKPENVLFRSVEGVWDVPKVADWGLSKHLLDHSKSVEGLSPQYAAPEQFDEEYGPTDDRTDVYQLGAVLYELFTGRPPFEGSPTAVMRAVMEERPTPPSDVADVPPALDDALMPALATDRRDRYDTVVYLRDAFRDMLDDR
ncbi:MAG: halocyanin domain-containing protein [Haloarculaceae archaeon]